MQRNFDLKTLKKYIVMNTPAQTRTYWIIFAVSTLAMIGILLSNHNEWFWVTLPFVLTYLAKAYDAI